MPCEKGRLTGKVLRRISSRSYTQREQIEPLHPLLGEIQIPMKPVKSLPPRPRWIVGLEYAAAAFCALLAAKYLRTVRAPEQWLMLAVAAPFGYLLADLCSGLVHWFGDTFFEEDTRVVGALFIAPAAVNVCR